MLNQIPFRLANGAWLGACLPAHWSFRRAMADPATAQAAILSRLVRKNMDSSFCRQHEFARLHSVADFQGAVPISSYDGLAPWIERIKEGAPRVFTTESVLMFEKTSGSSAAAKYIPYTASLRREFQNAVRAWIFDLYSKTPGLSAGSAYWCITPLAREREVSRGGLQIGFETDAEYLGKVEQLFLRKLLAVPNAVARIVDLDTSVYATLRFLLQTPSLTFVSVWHPSFLSILFSRLQVNAERLLKDLAEGSLRPPKALPPDIAAALQPWLHAEPRRAQQLRSVWREESRLSARAVWPELKVISCWTDAAAKFALTKLRESFPGVTVQGKGLLATEGVVSIPLVGRSGAALAVTSHFFEFVANESERPSLAHELEQGREYSIVITTGGGLWRYALGDRVRVTEFIGRTPLLEFIGKEDGISDLCGEKLNAVHVGQVLMRLADQGALRAGFAMLAPVQAKPPRYALYLDGHTESGRLAERLDTLLRDNPHYDYCRRLGQLDAPAVFRITQSAAEAYVRRCETLGQRAGNVKPAPLDRRFGWENVFQGEFVWPPAGAQVAQGGPSVQPGFEECVGEVILPK